MRRKDTDPAYELEVQTYQIRLYPGGNSSAPEAKVDGRDIALIILWGKGTPFMIHFWPDGVALPKSNYHNGFKVVQMWMNWCQLKPLMTLLADADSVQGGYSEGEQGPWADVQGQFARRPKRGKRK